MKKLSALAGAMLAIGMMTPVAIAAPLSAPGTAPEATSLIDAVQYRRDCVWVNGGWHHGRPGKYLVCKPYRPTGRGWVWHSEGPRHGWYHSQRRSWHNNKW